MSEWYHVGRLEIIITKQTLPVKSRLSSSAAICVLVARAFGNQPVMMRFDGNEISVDRLIINREMHWVISNVHGTKNTIQILDDLNRCFPFVGERCRQQYIKIGNSVNLGVGSSP